MKNVIIHGVVETVKKAGDRIYTIKLSTGTQGGGSVTVSGAFSEEPKVGSHMECLCGEKPLMRSALPVQASYVAGEEHMNALERYIAELGVPGVGEVSAHKIVSLYGTHSLEALRDMPEHVLENVDTIRTGDSFIEAAKEIISKDYERSFDVLWLMRNGLSKNAADKIMTAREGASIVTEVISNPYTLTKYDGFGFKKADEVAGSLGIEKTHPFRIAAGIRYALKRYEDDGYTCVRQDMLIRRAKDPYVLDLNNDPLIMASLSRQLAEKDPSLVKYNGNIYFTYNYLAEKSVADSIKARMKLAGKKHKEAVLADDFFERNEKEFGITYTDRQKAGVRACLNSPISIITGGPGTGKTTVTKAVIAALKESLKISDEQIACVAPTGIASKKMSQQTGNKASTIHTRLGFDPESHQFLQGINAKVAIVDETSMVDIHLMKALMNSLEKDTRLIFIGDDHQLPSVGPGSCLRDFLSSGTIPFTELDVVHRQGKNSDIIEVASKIRDGMVPDVKDFISANDGADILSRGGDFAFIPVDCQMERLEGNDFDSITEESKRAVRQKVEHVVFDVLPSMGYSPKDIEIISPTKRQADPASSFSLNPALRDHFNPVGADDMTFGFDFHVGDKVLLTKNIHELGIYNGDQGYVTNIEPGYIHVDFDGDGKSIRLNLEQAENLELGYAITVHKSQGSEFPVVVIPIHEGMGNLLLNRELIYTAITRGKSRVIIVGSENAFKAAIQNDKQLFRTSGLSTMLKENGRILYNVHKNTERVVSEQVLTPSPVAPPKEKNNSSSSLVIDNVFADLAGHVIQEDTTKQAPAAVLSVPEDKTLNYIIDAMKRAGLIVKVTDAPDIYEKLNSQSENSKIRFTGSKLTDRMYDELRGGVINPAVKSKELFVSRIDKYAAPLIPDLKMKDYEEQLKSSCVSGIWMANYQKPNQFFFRIPVDLIGRAVANQKREGDIGDLSLRYAVYNALPEIVQGAMDVRLQTRPGGGYNAAGLEHTLVAPVKFRDNYYRVELECHSGMKTFTIWDYKVTEIHPRETLKIVGQNEDPHNVYAEVLTGEQVLEGSSALRQLDENMAQVQDAGRKYGELFVNEVSSRQALLYGRAYGWVEGTTVFLTKDGLNSSNAIKNYAHLWAKAMQHSNPEGWASVISVVRCSGLWQEAINDVYTSGAYYNEDFIVAEVLARFSGKENVQLVERFAGKEQGVIAASEYFWAWSGKELLDIERFTSIDNISNRMLYDLLTGTDLNAYIDNTGLEITPLPNLDEMAAGLKKHEIVPESKEERDRKRADHRAELVRKDEMNHKKREEVHIHNTKKKKSEKSQHK